MPKPRAPGPTETIANKDGTPSATMAAFMREVAKSQDALIAALIASGALPEGWKP